MRYFLLLALLLVQSPKPINTSFGVVPEHRDHMDYYGWAAEYSMAQERAELVAHPQPSSQTPTYAQEDTPAEDPHSVKSCTNDGKKGTKENPRDCQCWNPCAEEYGIPEENRVHGDSRCATYCRKKNCNCKSPCL